MEQGYRQLCTEVYDFTKPIGHEINGDIGYYKERLRNCQGKVLEAGVGTGRVLIPLFQAGIDIDGIDSSQEMLEVCQMHCRKLQLTPRLLLTDLRNLNLPCLYEAIIMPVGTFLLITDYQEAVVVLQNLYRHLQDGGRLLFDIFLPDHELEVGQQSEHTFRIDENNTIEMKKQLTVLDFFKQITVTEIQYDKYRFQMHIATEKQSFAMRWYGIEELALLLKHVGFKTVKISADYQYGEAPVNQDQVYNFEAIK